MHAAPARTTPTPRPWVVTCVTLAGVEGPSAASAPTILPTIHSSLSLRAVRRRSRADRIGNPPPPLLNCLYLVRAEPKMAAFTASFTPSSTLNCSPPLTIARATLGATPA